MILNCWIVVSQYNATRILACFIQSEGEIGMGHIHCGRTFQCKCSPNISWPYDNCLSLVAPGLEQIRYGRLRTTPSIYISWISKHRTRLSRIKNVDTKSIYKNMGGQRSSLDPVCRATRDLMWWNIRGVERGKNADSKRDIGRGQCRRWMRVPCWNAESTLWITRTESLQ